MKLFKKVGAVFLALAMIAVMFPQLGSKVVKAAGNPYIYNVASPNSYFTPKLSQSSGDTKKITNFAKSFKAGSAMDKKGNGGINFTVKSGYAVVEFDVSQKTAGATSYLVVEDSEGIQLGKDLIDKYPDLAISPTKAANSGTESEAPEHFMLPAVCQAGTYLICRDSTKKNTETWLCQITVTEYDSLEEAEAKVDTYVKSITEKPKYTVSGKITSEFDLTGGTVSLETTASGASNVKSEPITKNDDGTYSYTTAKEVVVGDGAVYNVSVDSQALKEAKKTIQSAELAKVSFTVNTADKADADFEVKYNDIKNTWDFTNASDWSTCGYENIKEVVTYKGLVIDVTSGGKFATSVDTSTGNGRIQTNTGAKVRIPVSSWSGKVICTFGGDVADTTTLGDVKGNSTNTITAPYENTEYVELSIGAKNVYITKIEIKPDDISPITRVGASVRQETAAWGNGIRFGGQLDLTKVDLTKDNDESDTTCESGTLIGLADTVGSGNEMTIENVGTTCIKVKRTTFIKNENDKLEYAAALINIPNTELDTSIVARPYVTVNGITYYGEQIETSYNKVTEAVANVQ